MRLGLAVDGDPLGTQALGGQSCGLAAHPYRGSAPAPAPPSRVSSSKFPRALTVLWVLDDGYPVDQEQAQLGQGTETPELCPCSPGL